jgi:hypothetical protein
MRKVSPRIVWNAFLSVNIVLILGACMKPVDVKPFLEDWRIQEIINKDKTGGGVDVDIGFENAEDIPPELQAIIGGVPSSVAADETINLDNGDTITVTNVGEYDAIEWDFNGTILSTAHGVSGTGETLTVNRSVDLFNEAGVYSLTVIGTTGGGISYSTLFYINVES